MARDYEAMNAEEWENESDISTVRLSSPKPKALQLTSNNDTTSGSTDNHTHAIVSRNLSAPSTNVTNISQRNNTNANTRHPASRPIAGVSSTGRGSTPFKQRNRAGTGYRTTMPVASASSFINGTPGMPNRTKNPHIKSTAFPKLDPFFTTRAQEAIDKKKQENVQARKYLGQPEEGEVFKSLGHFQIEDTDGLNLLGENLEELNRIRQEFQVYIDYIRKTQRLRIRSSDQKDMNSVFRAIQLLVKELEALSSGSAPRYLIQPPTAEKYRRNVVAAATQTDLFFGGAPIIQGMKVAGPLMTNTEKVEYENTTYPNSLSSNSKVYFQHLKKRLGELRSLKTSMRMRVCFGIVQLNSYSQSLINRGMTFKEFSAMIQANRTRGAFSNRIGDSLTGEKLIKSILASNNIFCPSNYRITDLNDVKPEYVFIIHVKTPNNEALRVEVEVGCTYEEYTVSSVSLETKSKKSLSVSTITLDEGFDFSHELTMRELPEDHEPVMTSFRNKINEAKIELHTDSREEEYPRIHILKDHPFRRNAGHEMIDGDWKVENVVLRKLIVFALSTNPSFRIEVNVSRMWNGYKTTADPDDTYCGVSLCYFNWDALLAELANAEDEHIWNPELTEFFPNGFDSFHKDVDRIREFLTTAMRA